MLEGIARQPPENHKRLPAITQAAQAHRHAGLAAVTGEHYEGAHWLATFAVYLTTHGLSNPPPTSQSIQPSAQSSQHLLPSETCSVPDRGGPSD